MPEPVLEACELSKSFRGFHAVDGVSLRVEEGSIHALIGPNGAGKTTCFNLLTKTLEPTGGVIRYRGRDITGYAADRVARLGLVRSFQISAVFGGLTALDNVAIALQRSRGESFDFWRSRRLLEALRPRARELLEAVGLADFAEEPAAALSYGRKRALELATTLALEPDVMLLDEPTAGMAAEDVVGIAALIRKAARDRTVLMVEHNLGVVAELCDRITVLARGRILVEGDYETVSRDERVIESYIGGGGHA